MKHSIQNRKSEAGFTLVELAIVMIIIGVLLGGVLKGQEMISNARVTTTAADMESFSAATNTFFDQYGLRPGEMANANNRLADCGLFTACNGPTVNGSIPRFGTAQTNDETTAYFGQLLAAGLISGFDGSQNGATATQGFGTSHPTAPVGGGFIIGNQAGTAIANTGFTQTLATGRLYLGLTNSLAQVATAQGIISAEQAGAIDTRLDDGNPQSGYVIGQNLATDCVGTVGDTNYTGAGNPCVIAFRL